jgi:hypothetical protein
MCKSEGCLRFGPDYGRAVDQARRAASAARASMRPAAWFQAMHTEQSGLPGLCSAGRAGGAEAPSPPGQSPDTTRPGDRVDQHAARLRALGA